MSLSEIEYLNAALALLPVLMLLGAFQWLDVFHLITPLGLAKLLAMGALASLIVYPVSGRLLDALPLGFSYYSRFVAPWLEEGAKGAMLAFLFLRNRVGYKIDAALSGFAIGAGFALVENCIYLLRFPGLDPGIWMVRGIGTAVMHGGSAALMAAVSHQLAERDMRMKAGVWRPHPLLGIPGYLGAVAIHTLFNQFPDQPLVAMLLAAISVPLSLIAVFGLGAGEARHWLAADEATHRADLAALEGGVLPETDCGAAVGAFAAALDDRALAPLIQDYWRVQAEIVLSAERCMEERQVGQRLDRDAAADRARLARLHDLEQRIGRATLAHLRPLLPFSRNDLWEVDELRQQLKRT